MSEIEQKRLYEHFKKLATEAETSIQRGHCKGYAAEILKSFPQFEKPVKEEKPKTDSKEDKEKK